MCSSAWLQPAISTQDECWALLPTAKKRKSVHNAWRLLAPMNGWMKPVVAGSPPLRPSQAKAWSIDAYPWMKPAVSSTIRSAVPNLLNNKLGNVTIARVQSPTQHPKPDPQLHTAVELSLANVLLASEASVDQINDCRDDHFKRVQQVLSTPCLGSSAGKGGCSRCGGQINVKDASLFVSVFSTLTSSSEIKLLHGSYSTTNPGTSSDPGRCQWCFLGQPVCVGRLVAILGTSMRTLYKGHLAACHQLFVSLFLVYS